MKNIEEQRMIKILIKDIDLTEVDDFIDRNGTEATDRDGRTFLMSAVTKNKIELLKYLIQKKYDVNASDNQGMTPLHLAAINGLCEIAELLLVNGAQVDAIDAWGNTSLWRAAINAVDKNDDIVSLLLSHGADIDKQNSYEVSPKDLLSLSVRD